MAVGRALSCCSCSRQKLENKIAPFADDHRLQQRASRGVCCVERARRRCALLKCFAAAAATTTTARRGGGGNAAASQQRDNNNGNKSRGDCCEKKQRRHAQNDYCTREEGLQRCGNGMEGDKEPIYCTPLEPEDKNKTGDVLKRVALALQSKNGLQQLQYQQFK